MMLTILQTNEIVFKTAVFIVIILFSPLGIVTSAVYSANLKMQSPATQQLTNSSEGNKNSDFYKIYQCD